MSSLRGVIMTGIALSMRYSNAVVLCRRLCMD